MTRRTPTDSYVPLSRKTLEPCCYLRPRVRREVEEDGGAHEFALIDPSPSYVTRHAGVDVEVVEHESGDRETVTVFHHASGRYAQAGKYTRLQSAWGLVVRPGAQDLDAGTTWTRDAAVRAALDFAATGARPTRPARGVAGVGPS